MFDLLDPTDFPLSAIPELGLAVQVLPVTKVQFEYMLGGTPRFDPAVYPAMCTANPRSSWRGAPDRMVGLFATAVLPTEAEAFARWLGGGFRLPTDREWRAIDAALAVPADPFQLRAATTAPAIHPGQTHEKPLGIHDFHLFHLLAKLRVRHYPQ